MHIANSVSAHVSRVKLYVAIRGIYGRIQADCVSNYEFVSVTRVPLQPRIKCPSVPDDVMNCTSFYFSGRRSVFHDVVLYFHDVVLFIHEVVLYFQDVVLFFHDFVLFFMTSFYIFTTSFYFSRRRSTCSGRRSNLHYFKASSIFPF